MPFADYPPPRADHLDRLYRKAADSWWVFRHGLDHNGTPLPYGRIVYYATTEQEARRWLDAQGAPYHAG